MRQYTRFFLFIASLSKEGSHTVLPKPRLLTHKVLSEALALVIAEHACSGDFCYLLNTFANRLDPD